MPHTRLLARLAAVTRAARGRSYPARICVSRGWLRAVWVDPNGGSLPRASGASVAPRCVPVPHARGAASPVGDAQLQRLDRLIQPRVSPTRPSRPADCRRSACPVMTGDTLVGTARGRTLAGPRPTGPVLLHHPMPGPCLRAQLYPVSHRWRSPAQRGQPLLSLFVPEEARQSRGVPGARKLTHGPPGPCRKRRYPVADDPLRRGPSLTGRYGRLQGMYQSDGRGARPRQVRLYGRFRPPALRPRPKPGGFPRCPWVGTRVWWFA